MATHPPQYLTLQAGVTASVTFSTDLAEVEILNIDGTDEIWVRFGGSGSITPMTTGTYVVPASIGYLSTDPETSGPTVVWLMSDTALRVGIRGVDR